MRATHEDHGRVPILMSIIYVKILKNATVRQDLQDEQDFVTKSYPVDPHPVQRKWDFLSKSGKKHLSCAQYLYYLHYLIIGADISASMNCFGNMELQMNANTRRCEIPLRRMNPAQKTPNFPLFASWMKQD